MPQKLRSDILENIFGSRTRVKIFRLFFAYPQELFFVREISRKVDEQINSVRRELQNLEEMGMLKSEQKEKKKFYNVDTEFPLYEELRALILKSQLTLQKAHMESIASLGTVQYLALMGYFVQDSDAKVDVFVVGKVSRQKLDALLVEFQKQFGQQLRFTLMTPEEFSYRKEVSDKFLYELINGEKMLLIDSLQPQSTPYAG